MSGQENWDEDDEDTMSWSNVGQTQPGLGQTFSNQPLQPSTGGRGRGRGNVPFNPYERPPSPMPFQGQNLTHGYNPESFQSHQWSPRSQSRSSSLSPAGSPSSFGRSPIRHSGAGSPVEGAVGGATFRHSDLTQRLQALQLSRSPTGSGRRSPASQLSRSPASSGRQSPAPQLLRSPAGFGRQSPTLSRRSSTSSNVEDQQPEWEPPTTAFRRTKRGRDSDEDEDENRGKSRQPFGRGYRQ